MKVRNIVFSGFMASILMAGAASAAIEPTSTLATTSYVQGGVEHAITTSEDYTDAAIGTLASGLEYADGTDVNTNIGKLDAAIKTNATAISTETTNRGTAITNALTTAQGYATAAESNAKDYADTKDTEKIGDLGGKTVKAYVDGKISDVGGDTSALAADIADIKDGDIVVGKATADAEGNVIKTVYATKSELTSKVESLDASESQDAGGDGLALSIEEVDGIITSISGSIAANTYDASGAAAAVQTGVEDGTIVAAKATKDGNGAVISTTYATKAEMKCGNNATDLCLVANNGTLSVVTTSATWGE